MFCFPDIGTLLDHMFKDWLVVYCLNMIHTIFTIFTSPHTATTQRPVERSAETTAWRGRATGGAIW